MLFSPIDNAQMSRVQGVFLTENDIENLTNQWDPYFEKYSLEMLEIPEEDNVSSTQISGDTLYDQALDLSSQSNTLSTSLLQRRLRIGYPRAARLMDELEENGIVGPGEAGKPRKVLIG
jgi:S-DNA-T family DNA segregation ATPase FtsK/SpoIIIE